MFREVATIQAQVRAPGADFLGAVAFSPDGKWLATGGTTERPKLWDTRTWKLKGELPNHRRTRGRGRGEQVLGTLAVSPDEHLFAVATGHGSVVKVYEW